ncbi:hypothetical protein [Pseudomonas brenneri]|uniref:Uncharacterized protein n=1 Tax=Pseudomonas brenneri TaxID=129817 RepID=A0A5B2UPS6_9PSED|nr:hypothetical protein [Pseudomonas brenneri]KAA6172621.1 hypothetical protein F3K50_15080 [Pseudomonas marginalis]KAA2228671.1 hypothetical protein F1720_18880 [Pseudomonas brenneri]TWR76179.1 hypothetical protein FJD34_22005 [Pseudomonas brenneri]SDU85634.1 hypothetical protein SAMN04490181_0582 [Pseudomonas brenneri]GGL46608.1 hypothetical protein GCM10009091_30470 [Pseudomonas brenneri]
MTISGITPPTVPSSVTIEPQTSTTSNPQAPKGAHGRPAGDTRSAEQIFKDNPILKDVLKQNGPFANNFFNQLKNQTGDWSPANRNPESRADAAYNLAEVVNHLNGRADIKRQDPAQQNDQHIQGFGQFGSVSAGSEAQKLKAFSEKGYSAL